MEYYSFSETQWANKLKKSRPKTCEITILTCFGPLFLTNLQYFDIWNEGHSFFKNITIKKIFFFFFYTYIFKKILFSVLDFFIFSGSLCESKILFLWKILNTNFVKLIYLISRFFLPRLFEILWPTEISTLEYQIIV